MLNKITVLLILISFQISYSQNISSFFTKSDLFFKEYVMNGKVDYAAIKSNPENLIEILNIAKNISVEKDDAKNYQAFWINAYNLSVINQIIKHYPTKSPLDHAGFFDRTKHELGGKKITLNDIEHKLLRAQFKDARFHFVLVCGAIGCPPLINKAYMPNDLEDQLETQTKLALNSDYFIKVNPDKKKVYGSEILKWYKKDFTRNGTKEIDFINKYREEKIPENYKLSYFTYNWSLNKQ